MRLEEPSTFEIGPRRMCRGVWKCLIVSQSACLASSQKRTYCGVDFHSTTIFKNNDGGDTCRKYIATIESSQHDICGLTSIKKRSNSPDTRCHARRRLSLDRQPSLVGFWLCRQVLLCVRQRLFSL